MRVIVVDDDSLICDSLEIILGAQDGIDVVGTGTSGHDAVRLFAELDPDVALLDIQMPGRDGLSAAREILRGRPDARIVFLATFSDDGYIVQALRLGARGYLIKQDVAAIAPAPRSVMRGQSVLEGEVLARISRMSETDGDAEGGVRSAAVADAGRGRAARAGRERWAARQRDGGVQRQSPRPRSPARGPYSSITSRSSGTKRLPE